MAKSVKALINPVMLAWAREQAGFSPDEAARRLNIDEQRLNALEEGEETPTFAKLLGITRLHMTSIEVGRRQPSLELALRWLALLAPEARLDMFGPLPVVEERVRLIKQLQQVAPEFFKAA